MTRNRRRTEPSHCLSCTYLLSWLVPTLMSIPAGSLACPVVGIRQGGHFDFFCASANVFSEFQFQKDGRRINLTDSTKYKRTYSILRVNSVTKEDAGLYNCTAFYNGVRTSFCTMLSVLLRPVPKPTIYTGLDSPPRRTLPAGESHTLTCRAPRAVIVLWYKDGVALSRTDEGKIRWNNTSQKLSFTNVTAEDTGNYSCEACNSRGCAWADFFLLVKDPATVSMVTTDHSPVSIAVQSRTASVASTPSTNLSTSRTNGTHSVMTTSLEQSTTAKDWFLSTVKTFFQPKSERINQIHLDVSLMNPCQRKSAKPEFLLFTQVHHLIEDRCPKCTSTFLQGDESVQRLEDHRDGNCTNEKLVFRITLKVRYANANHLFHLLHHPLDIGEDTIFIPHGTWASQWKIISTCVKGHYRHRLCWTNLNIVHTHGNVSPTTSLKGYTTPIGYLSPMLSSSSAIHSANKIILFVTLTVLLITIVCFQVC